MFESLVNLGEMVEWEAGTLTREATRSHGNLKPTQKILKPREF